MVLPTFFSTLLPWPRALDGSLWRTCHCPFLLLLYERFIPSVYQVITCLRKYTRGKQKTKPRAPSHEQPPWRSGFTDRPLLLYDTCVDVSPCAHQRRAPSFFSSVTVVSRLSSTATATAAAAVCAALLCLHCVLSVINVT